MKVPFNDSSIACGDLTPDDLLPKPAPDAVREALQREIARSRSLIATGENTTYPSINSARYVRQTVKELLDAADIFLSAAVPLADTKQILYSILTKYYAKDATLDQVYQDIKEARILK